LQLAFDRQKEIGRRLCVFHLEPQNDAEREDCLRRDAALGVRMRRDKRHYLPVLWRSECEGPLAVLQPIG
jgi:hypothetical protein